MVWKILFQITSNIGTFGVKSNRQNNLYLILIMETFNRRLCHIFNDIYSHPDDIDLLTGILTESRQKGSVLGPLGQCLIAEQFQRLKEGDRYFFERPDEDIGFTKGKQLKATTVKSIIFFCVIFFSRVLWFGLTTGIYFNKIIYKNITFKFTF